MAQPFLTFIFVCSACLVDAARIHRGSGQGLVVKAVEECRSAGDKSQIASCVCRLANGDGLSPKSVAEECSDLRMTAMKMAMPWSCALRKTPKATTCGAMHPWRAGADKPAPTNNDAPVVEERQGDERRRDDPDEDLDDLDVFDDDELEEEEEEEIVPNVVPKEDFREESQKCSGRSTKAERATCVCSLAKGNGLTSHEVVDRCKALRMPIMMVATPWSCRVTMTGTKANCRPMFPFRRPGGKDGPALPIIVERRDTDLVTHKDDLDDYLDEDEELEEDEQDGQEPSPVDCQGVWHSWSSCSRSCGGGTRTRGFGITTPVAHGGAACPASPESEACNTHGCPVDCSGSWSPWGACSANCNGGKRSRSFIVTRHAENGGVACPANHQEEACNTHGCPVDCEMRIIRDYHGCTRSCGGGETYQYWSIARYPQNGGKACHATKFTTSCNNHGCPRPPDCFPADALVDTYAGRKTMSDLRVGDAVRSVDGTGRTFFDRVYFFGHADGASKAQYINLELMDEQMSLQVSGRHFLPRCPAKNIACEWEQHVHVYAKDISAGDYIFVAPSANSSSHAGQVALRKVSGTSLVQLPGLYNPYTISGKVVVNGVVASAHSEWVIDDLLPETWAQYLPAVYQVAFLPGRWLYHLLGPVAADLLDVNNPQIAGHKHGLGPEFLAACVAFFLSIGMLSPVKRVLGR